MRGETDVGQVRVTCVRERVFGAGESVREGKGAGWRVWWVVRGSGEYRRAGAVAKFSAGAVVLGVREVVDLLEWDDHVDGRVVEVGFEVARQPGVRWRRGLPLVVERVEGDDALGVLMAWLWGNRRHLREEVTDRVMGAVWGMIVSGRTGGVREPRRVVLPEVVERAVTWMRARVSDRPADVLTNAEIARAAGCSVPWLQFLFKRHFDCYPVQLARRARLDRAIDLLAETELPIAIVAGMCGFVSGSHLSLWLRKLVGEDATGMRRGFRSGEGWRVERLSPLTGGVWEEG